jgi:hypothetical protein
MLCIFTSGSARQRRDVFIWREIRQRIIAGPPRLDNEKLQNLKYPCAFLSRTPGLPISSIRRIRCRRRNW